MAVSMMVPFFLTPIVIHGLGTVAYGVWILAVSTVAYLNLLDLGLRSAIVRFVCAADAQQKADEVKTIVSSALWLRSLIAVVAVVAAVVLAVVFPHVFKKVPGDLARASQITVLLVALGVAITLVSNVFNGVLAAMSRFDLLSSISMTQTVIRAIGVILILRAGHGLVALAWWEFATVTLTGIITVVTAFRIYPPCRVRLARPDRAILKLLWSHSFITFIWSIAAQVILYTDNVVIGICLDVGLVAYYAIGGSLELYSGQVVGALSTTFLPIASRLDASGDNEQLRRLLVRGTQAALAILFPISLTLFFRGKTFVGLWMGQQYSLIAGTVIQILLISQFFNAAASTPSSMMMASGKHKPVAIASVISAVLNLGLSIVLAKTVGVYGVAWGTSIATTLIFLGFWPAYLRKMLDVPILFYLWNALGKVSLCAIPFGVICAMADRYWHPHNLVIFFAQVLATLPLYGLCVLVVFRKEAMGLFRRWQLSRQAQSQAVN
ncbi:oligosaccharide flippase family protein [Edaphobacter sp.]|uniref:oligosaccharide flippase family protein n=1 Tax=Edaphobacter sp. TaxID=1934404 RepID=UPI002DC050BF|nr:oligosaccharide flippase family protein [Edaphobacter sp.]HEU5340730.1 oligosaccharide flippase family protein [Edaphobacter sp.]